MQAKSIHQVQIDRNALVIQVISKKDNQMFQIKYYDGDQLDPQIKFPFKNIANFHQVLVQSLKQGKVKVNNNGQLSVSLQYKVGKVELNKNHDIVITTEKMTLENKMFKLNKKTKKQSIQLINQLQTKAVNNLIQVSTQIKRTSQKIQQSNKQIKALAKKNQNLQNTLKQSQNNYQQIIDSLLIKNNQKQQMLKQLKEQIQSKIQAINNNIKDLNNKMVVFEQQNQKKNQNITIQLKVLWIILFAWVMFNSLQF